MLLHNKPLFRIYFGDAKDKLFPDQYLNFPSNTDLFSINAFNRLKDVMKLEHIVFLKQIHSDKGYIIKSKEHAKEIRSFVLEGDYLVTNSKFVGLGVVTADCLPIVLYDPLNQVVSVIHAGWRGSSKNIVLKAIDSMIKEFGTKPKNIQAFFGPSAKVCCYSVGQEMLDEFEDFEFIDRVVQKRGEDVFFDISIFNKILLKTAGVKSESIKLEYNICTMCDHSFYSYRRQGKKSGRQMTVVSLI